VATGTSITSPPPPPSSSSSAAAVAAVERVMYTRSSVIALRDRLISWQPALSGGECCRHPGRPRPAPRRLTPPNYCCCCCCCRRHLIGAVIARFRWSVAASCGLEWHAEARFTRRKIESSAIRICLAGGGGAGSGRGPLLLSVSERSQSIGV